MRRLTLRPAFCGRSRSTRASCFGLWSELRSCDEIVFTGSPPLLLHWIAPLNILLRKRLVYRITDFHPECLIAARGRSSWWLSLIYRLTLFWRRRVTVFEVLGEDQKARLIEIGIEEERIRVKPDRSPVVIDEATAPLARPKARGGQGTAPVFRQLGRRSRLRHLSRRLSPAPSAGQWAYRACG